MQSISKGTNKIVLERVHISFQYDLKTLFSGYEAEFLSSGKSK